MGTPWSSATYQGFDAFISAFTDSAVWRSLYTTLVFAFVCVSAEMILGIALALALEERKQNPQRHDGFSYVVHLADDDRAHRRGTHVALFV